MGRGFDSHRWLIISKMNESEIQIEKLQAEDINRVKFLVEAVIKDSFQGEGLNLQQYQKELEAEISSVQKKFDCFQNNSYHFWVAKSKNEIIGTIGLGPLGKPIQKALEKFNQPAVNMVEIMSLYIHPSSQGQGIGSKLFSHILKILEKTNYYSYSLSTGYTKGKKFWSKKLGNPDVILEKYYGNNDCWIWLKDFSRPTICVN